ncbi:MAG: spermidine/putrescine ABC transporter substrate-binding protein [Acidobacteriota bacterium]
MRRRAFLTAGVLAAACSRGPRLNVYNWSDYIGPETIPQFEREFGLRVHYGTYESNQEMLAQVMSGNSGWDVVFPSGDFIEPMRALRLLAPLDHTLLPNMSALAAEFQHPPWDPDLQWCIPYMHGVTGILYQRSLQPPPATWADLWNARLRGRLTMLDDEPEVLGVCLKKLGHSINSGKSDELVGARQEALAQKPLLRAYLNAEVRDQAVAGDVLAAQAWAVTAAQAIAAAPGKLAFSFPSEGFPRFADNVAILRESRRVEAAHRWIDFLMRPQVAAGTVMATHTASANQEALRYLPPEIRQDPVLYPSPEPLARGEWFEAQPAASQKLRDRLWTEIKNS